MKKYYIVLTFILGMITTKVISIPEEKLYIIRVHVQTEEDMKSLVKKLQKKYIVEVETKEF